MYIQEIYKIVVRDADSLNSRVDPRIFFNREKAEEFAKRLWAEGIYEEIEIGSIVIYREIPDVALGWFTTAGMSYVTKE